MEKNHLRKKEKFIKFLLQNHYYFKFIMKDGSEESDCSLFDDLSRFLQEGVDENILEENEELRILPKFDTNKDDPYSYYDEDDNDERYKEMRENSIEENKLKAYMDSHIDDRYNLKNIKSIVILEENYNINFSGIFSIPDNVIFKNKGYLKIPDIYKIPSNTEFRNEGHVYMEYIKSIGDNVVFEDESKVHIRFLNIGGNIVEMCEENLLDGILERLGSYSPLAKDTMEAVRNSGMGIDGISMSRLLNKTISRIDKN